MRLLAQVDTAAELTVQQLGAFAIALLVCFAAIAWLIRDRAATTVAHGVECARLIADRDAERAANRELSSGLVDQAERLIPVLDRGARAIEDAARLLDRQERGR